MQNKKIKRILSFLLSIMLIAAMAVITTACNDNKTNEQETVQTTKSFSLDFEVLGEGEKSFYLKVVEWNDNETRFLIKTDKTTVGEALQELGLISGEEGQFGLYVKTVNGVTLDYDKDKLYWSFYVYGEYATTGIDVTEIEENAEYELKAEKA